MIAATLHGPNYFAPNHDEHSIEVFTHLGEAIEALLSRYNGGNYSSHHVEYLDGSSEDVLFPAFGEGTRFEVYGMNTETLATDYPETHEGIVTETLSAVHLGVRDYTLTLEYVGETMSVTVLPA